MIYIYPIGGLGNMLFHIASIYALAKDNCDDLCLLNLDQKIKELDNSTNVTDTWSNTTHCIEYNYLFKRFSQSAGHDYIRVNCFRSPEILEYKPYCQYEGYFQNEKYFKHRREEIIHLFAPDKDHEPIIDRYSHLFGNIGLHVRRSWINLKIDHIHPVQSMDYYNKAIAMLPEDKKIIIASDDLDWCKENFKGERFVFLDEKDYIIMYVMAKMKYLIIANSTFSWWWAWLSEAENIIAPLMWAGAKSRNKNIVPKEWTQI